MNEQMWYVVESLTKDGKQVFLLKRSTKKKPVPATALFVHADKVEVFEMRMRIREAKKGLRNKQARWARGLAALRSVKAAPAFREYLKAIMDSHIGDEPKFDPKAVVKEHSK